MKKTFKTEKQFSKFAFLTASSLLSAGLLTHIAYAGDLPSGGVVSHGSAKMTYSKDHLNIDQSSAKAIINWQSFSVGTNKSVHFDQPTADSIALNRVTGDFTSEIAGKVTADGSVVLVNPNGIVITADGTVDTANFTGSTLNITDQDFIQGNYTFSKNGKNGVIDNRGTIKVDDGGYVALLGGAIKNDGRVTAHLGKVGFAGGEKIVMSFGDNDFLRVEIPTAKFKTLKDADGNPLSATLDINGTISASGGLVEMKVADASDLLRQIISVKGIVKAHTIQQKDGVISIGGGDITLTDTAKLSVDADKGDAGRIKVHAQNIRSQADFSANAKQGKGGNIDVTAKKGLVHLVSGSFLADGHKQGGRIRIGGSFQGGGYNKKVSYLSDKDKKLFVERWGAYKVLASAKTTTIKSPVKMSANSVNGDGGTVVVWADDTTTNKGTISATGKSSGGSVEVSGKKILAESGLGKIKLGNGGTVLLDPKNARITFYTSNSNISRAIEASDVASQLKSNTNVLVVASNDIIVEDDIDADTSTRKGALRLMAGRSIKITANITMNGPLTLMANLDSFYYTVYSGLTTSERDSGQATITMSKDKKLDSGLGMIKIQLQAGMSGATDRKKSAGKIELATVTGNRVSIQNWGTTSDYSSADIGKIVILNGGASVVNAITATKYNGVDKDDILLEIVGSKFINNSASGALATTSNKGRYLVWTKKPSGNSLSGTSTNLFYSFSQFNMQYKDDHYSRFFQKTDKNGRKVQGSGSGFLYSSSPTININASGSLDKPYDGDSDASTNLTYRLANGDSRGYVQYDGSTFAYNRWSAGGASNFKINVSGVSAAYYDGSGNKTKDANTNLTVKYTIGSINVQDGNGKRTYGLNLKINDRTGAKITRKEIALNGSEFKVANRSYDNTTDVTHTVKAGENGMTDSDILGGETVTLTIAQGAFVYASKDADTNKQINIGDTSKFTLGGTDKKNYVLKISKGDKVNNFKGTVTKKILVLTMSDFNPITKTYDGSTSIAGSSVSLKNSVTRLTGVYNGDTVILTVRDDALVFDSKDAGGTPPAGKTIKVAKNSRLELSGKDAGNYKFTYSANDNSGLTGEIKKKTLTITADVATTRVYNGLKSVTLTNNKITGWVAADVTNGLDTTYANVVQGTLAGAVDDQNAGTGKTVKFSGVALKAASTTYKNYVLKPDTSKKIDITQRTLTLTADVADRVYNGTQDITLSNKKITGWAPADTALDKTYANVVSGILSATVTSKNIGTGKAVKFTGVSLKDPTTTYKNYILKMDTSKTVDITVRSVALDGSEFRAGREYDGTTRVEAKLKTNKDGLKDSDKIAWDTVTLTVGAGGFVYANPNVHTYKPVYIGDKTQFSLTGKDAGNYELAALTDNAVVAGLIGRIGRRSLTVTADVAGREYNGLTTLTLSNYKVTGWAAADVANTNLDKTYATVVQGTLTGSIANKKAEKDKPVKFDGVRLNNAAAYNNYVLKMDTSKTVTITPVQVTLAGSEFKIATRQYDGTSQLTATLKTGKDGLQDGKVIRGDDVKLQAGIDAFTFAGPHQGVGKRVIMNRKDRLSLTGNDGGNYVFTTTLKKRDTIAGLTGTIQKRNLYIEATDFKVADREYDGTKTVDAQLKTGKSGLIDGTGGRLLGNDSITLVVDQGGFEYKTEDAGRNKQINYADASKFRLTTTWDARALGNYIIKIVSGNSAVGFRGHVTTRTLTLAGSEFEVADRVYDGTTAVAATKKTNKDGFTDGQAVDGDAVTLTVGSGAFVYDSKNIGRTKQINIGDKTKFSLTGSDAKNYKLSVDDDGDKVNGFTGRVTAKELTLDGSEFEVAERVYDGTKTVAATKKAGKDGITDGQIVTVKGVKEAITLTMAAAAFEYVNENKGDTKLIKVASNRFGLTGSTAGNYVLKITDGSVITGFTGKVTARQVTLDGSELHVADRVYNNKTTLSATLKPGKDGLKDAGVVSKEGVKDDVKLDISSGAFVYASRNAGSGKRINIGNKNALGITGSDVGNYIFNLGLDNGDKVDGFTGNIKTKELFVTAYIPSRQYNGTKSLSVSRRMSGWIVGDKTPGGQALNIADYKVFAPGGSRLRGELVDKNAGPRKAVRLWGVRLNRASRDYDNYHIKIDDAKTVNIRKRELLVTATVKNKEYDGNDIIQIQANSQSITNWVANDKKDDGTALITTWAGALDGSLKAKTADKKAGIGRKVTFSGVNLKTGGDYKNYQIKWDNSKTVDITQKELTLDGNELEVANRQYDGTTAVAATKKTGKDGLTDGKIVSHAGNKDTVTLSIQSGAFVYLNIDADTNKQIRIGDTNKIGLTGTDASNYKLTLPAGVIAGFTGNITKREVTLDGSELQVGSRVYNSKTKVSATLKSGKDGLTDATVVSRAGVKDDVKLNIGDGAFVYDSKNAGTGKRINIGDKTALGITGRHISNYIFKLNGLDDGDRVTGFTGDITTKELLVTADGKSRQYDGKRAVDLENKGISGWVANDKKDDGTTPLSTTWGDVLTGTLAGKAENKDAGTWKLGLSGVSLKGGNTGDYKNYHIKFDDGKRVTINKRKLLVTATVKNRDYDGTDVIQIQANSETITNWVANDKKADGTALVTTWAGSLTGTLKAKTADKKAGVGKAVTFSGVSLKGGNTGDYKNYEIDWDTSKTVDIRQKELTLDGSEFEVANRQYDGTTAVAATKKTGKDGLTDGGILGRDVVTLTVSAGAFEYVNENKGDTKAIKVASGNFGLGGTHKDNYILKITDGSVITGFTGKVTAKEVTLDGSELQVGSRAYNGKTELSATLKRGKDGLTDATVVSRRGVKDDVKLDIGDGAFVYASRNAGTGKRINIGDKTALGITGSHAGNYIFKLNGLDDGDRVTGFTGDIVTRELLVTADGKSRQYDGKRAVDLENKGISGWVANDKKDDGTTPLSTTWGDVLTGTLAGKAENKDAGTWKLELSGVSLKGGNTGDYKNYHIKLDDGKRVTINKRKLLVSATVKNREYDGSDVIDIQANSETITNWVANDKKADGTALVTTWAGSLTGTLKAKTADKKAGVGKAVTFSGVSLKGGNTGDYKNYEINWDTSKTVDIRQKELTLDGSEFEVANRQYDGTKAVAATKKTGKDGLTDGKIISYTDGSKDTVTLSIQSGAFEYVSVDADTNKQIKIGATNKIGLTGTDASNYKLTLPAGVITGFTGDITKRELTVTGNVANRVYNGTRVVSVTGQTVTGFATADVTAGIDTSYGSVVSANLVGTVADKKVGTNKAVTFNRVTLKDATTTYKNYVLKVDDNNKKIDITVKTVTLAISELKVESRKYDTTRTVDAKLKTGKDGLTDSEVMSPGGTKDDVTLSIGAGAFVYADANKESSKKIYIGDKTALGITGTDAGNYLFRLNLNNNDLVNGFEGEITLRELTLDGSEFEVANRQYDGTTAVAASKKTGKDGLTDGGILGADVVTLTVSAGAFEYVNENKGDTKAIKVVSGNFGLGGTHKDNYILKITDGSVITGFTGKVTAREVTLDGSELQVGSRAYNGKTELSATLKRGKDGLTDATVMSRGGVKDDVKLDIGDGAFVYASRNAGTGKRINIGDKTALGITGSHAGNYIFKLNGLDDRDRVTGFTGDIVTRELLVTADGKSRQYDGKRAVDLENKGISGWVANDKKDDGTTPLSTTWGDVLTGTLAGKAENKDAGTWKLELSGVSLKGGNTGDYKNYHIKFDDGKRVTINKRKLLVSATVKDREYDGSDVIQIQANSETITNWVANDKKADGTALVTTWAGSLTGTLKAKTADKKAGVGKAVTFSGVSLKGGNTGDYKNYEINWDTSKTVDIRQKELTLDGSEFEVARRIYDRTMAVAATKKTGKDGLTDSKIVSYADGSKDTVSLSIQSGAFVYLSADADINKQIKIGDTSKISLTGTDASNYKLTLPTGVITGFTGDIAKWELTVTGTVSNRVYDGTRVVSVTGQTVTGFAPADIAAGMDTSYASVVSANLVGTVADKKVGTNKAVTFNRVTLKDATTTYKNYVLKVDDNNKKIDITVKTVTLAISELKVESRKYDTTRTVDAKLKTGKDGLTDSEVMSPGGTKDDVKLSIGAGAFVYADANKESSKKIYIGDKTALGITGTDAGNYLFRLNLNNNDLVNGFEGEITARELTLDGSEFKVANRVYDGTKTVAASKKNNKDGLTDGGILGRDVVTLTVSAGAFEYADENKGDTKAIKVVSGNFGLGGTHKDNYILKITDGSVITGFTGKVTAKEVTLDGSELQVGSRAYNGKTELSATLKRGKDGLTDATVVSRGGVKDDVKLDIGDGAFVYASRNADTGKRINIGDKTALGITGSHAGNYIFKLNGLDDGDRVTGFTGTVTTKELLVTADGKSRQYDGKRTVDLENKGISGWVANDKKDDGTPPLSTTWNDVLTGTLAGKAEDKDAGTWKLELSGVSLKGGNTGDYKNYHIKFDDGKRVTINKRKLLVTATVKNREYDGSDVIDIQANSETITNWVANDKKADGTALVTTWAGSLTGTLKANTADKKAGVGKAVTFSGVSLKGGNTGDYKNYEIDWDTSKTVDIRQKELTLDGSEFEVANRQYDGTTAVAASKKTGKDGLTDGGILGRDVVTLTVSAGAFEYVNENKGDTKAIKVASGNFGLGGTHKDNYILKITDGSVITGFTGKVTAREVTLDGSELQVGSRAYNGKTELSATLKRGKDGLTDATVVSRRGVKDDVKLDIGDGAFVYASRNAGTGKRINIGDKTALGITGSHAGNYIFKLNGLDDRDRVTGFTGDIVTRELLITADGKSRQYDGKRAVDLENKGISGWVANDKKDDGTTPLSTSWNDVLTGTLAGKAEDKDAGTWKLELSGVSLKGGNTGDYKNYHIKFDDGKRVTINKRKLLVSATVKDREYNGSDVIGIQANSETITNWVANDKKADGTALVTTWAGSLTGTLKAKTADKKAGVGKAVTFSGVSLKGGNTGDYKNYEIDWDTSKTVDIRQKELTLDGSEFEVARRVYDGTTAVAATKKTGKDGLTDGKIISYTDGSKDTVTLSIQSGAFEYVNVDAHTNKQIKIGATNKIGLTGTDASNYKLTLPAGVITGFTGDITKRELTVTGNVANRVYNGTRVVSVTGQTVTGFATADVTAGIDTSYASVVSANLVGTVADKKVGRDKAVTFNRVTLKDAGTTYKNYVLKVDDDNKKIDITAKTVTLAISELKVESRKYDTTRTVDAKLKTGKDGLTDSEVMSPGGTKDDVKLSIGAGAFVYADANKEGSKKIYIGDKTALGITGTDAGNYLFRLNLNNNDLVNGFEGEITARELTLDGSEFEVANRQYDGTTAVAATKKTGKDGLTDGGILGRDVVTLTVSAGAFEYADENKGDTKAIKVVSGNFGLGGTHKDNYILKITDGSVITGFTGKVTAREVTLDGSELQVGSRAYNGKTELSATLKRGKDGLTDATVMSRGGVKDDVKLDIGDGAFVYASRNAGTGKRINIGDKTALGITGSHAGNYIFKLNGLDDGDRVTGFTGDIVTRELLVTADGKSRQYDGKRAVDLENKGISGWVANDKKDDGTTPLSTSWGDVLTGTLAGKAENKDADTWKLELSGVSLKGGNTGDYKNYHIKFDDGKRVTINKRKLLVTATVKDREYDGSDVIQIQANSETITNWVANDKKADGTALVTTWAGSLTGTLKAKTADKKAGVGKAVTFSGVSLKGGNTGDYKNYEIDWDTSKTVDIRQKELTLDGSEFTVATRTYDTTTDATTTLNTGEDGLDDARVILNDDVKIDVNTDAFVFDTKHASIGKTIKIGKNANFNLRGADATNYRLVTLNEGDVVNGLTGTINKQRITLKGSDYIVVSRQYDGTTDVNIRKQNSGIKGVLGGEDVNLSFTDTAFVYADKNAGKDKKIKISDKSQFSLLGKDIANYQLDLADDSVVSGVKGEIIKRTLTFSADVTDRVYNGSILLDATNEQITGWVQSDTLDKSLGGATEGRVRAFMENKDAGNGKKVIFDNVTLKTGGGYDNYALKFDTTKVVNIARKSVTINIDALEAKDKFYDGNAKASVVLKSGKDKNNNDSLVGVLQGDRVTLDISGANFKFSDAEIGKNKQVSLGSGSTLSLSNTKNYVLDSSTVDWSTLVANINKPPVSVDGSVDEEELLKQLDDDVKDVTVDPTLPTVDTTDVAQVDNTGAGNTGAGNAGADNTGAGNTGAGNAGADNAGAGNAGADNAGADNAGAGNAGADNAGADNAGAGNAGADNTEVAEVENGEAENIGADTTEVAEVENAEAENIEAENTEVAEVENTKVENIQGENTELAEIENTKMENIQADTTEVAEVENTKVENIQTEITEVAEIESTQAENIQAKNIQLSESKELFLAGGPLSWEKFVAQSDKAIFKTIINRDNPVNLFEIEYSMDTVSSVEIPAVRLQIDTESSEETTEEIRNAASLETR